MLDFRDVFSKNHQMTSENIPAIMKCKNIDFGHTNWLNFNQYRYYNDVNLMTHIIDNILDINIPDNGIQSCYTYAITLVYYNYDDSWLINRMFDNGGVTCDMLDTCCESDYVHKQCVYHLRAHRKHMQLVKYLTDVSLNRFTKYYNLSKYYYVIHVMMLVIKVQKRVPNIIIKHLIIQFVYQH